MNNDRFKFRTPWYCGDKFAGFQYWEFEHGQVKLIGDYWESWVSKRDKLTAKPDEQCTGLSDKNGNLIYENDYIKDKLGVTIYLIKWVDAKFMNSDIDDMMPDTSPRQDWLDRFGFEIIGNIHEQIEHKDAE